MCSFVWVLTLPFGSLSHRILSLVLFDCCLLFLVFIMEHSKHIQKQNSIQSLHIPITQAQQIPTQGQSPVPYTPTHVCASSTPQIILKCEANPIHHILPLIYKKLIILELQIFKSVFKLLPSSHIYFCSWLWLNQDPNNFYTLQLTAEWVSLSPFQENKNTN